MTNNDLGSDISTEITAPPAADLNDGDVLILDQEAWICSFVGTAELVEELGVAVFDLVSEVHPRGEYVQIETADGREFTCHRAAEVAVRRRIPDAD
ncbi:hypothetical protein OOJ91_34060 [Micromonospora lupini]|uniref:hypothetical protein n=1 Tax=Micromonospora lupini TaxID=285679 RepID=UPI00225406DF|nr:hypothetical protein [Micromonospora lupini]MCX5070874.1 hypothetical protein [Micromonospora lupini]